jgi:hypothetical protein
MAGIFGVIITVPGTIMVCGSGFFVTVASRAGICMDCLVDHTRCVPTLNFIALVHLHFCEVRPTLKNSSSMPQS